MKNKKCKWCGKTYDEHVYKAGPVFSVRVGCGMIKEYFLENTTTPEGESWEIRFNARFNGVLETKFIPEDPRVPPITRFCSEEIKSFIREEKQKSYEEGKKAVSGEDRRRFYQMGYNEGYGKLEAYKEELRDALDKLDWSANKWKDKGECWVKLSDVKFLLSKPEDNK